MVSKDITTTQKQWDLSIRPQRSWWDLRLGELWRYRDLIWLFVRRDFVAYYKQTILGPLWYVIQPVVTTLVFTVIFGNIAKLPTDGLPPFLFYLAGTTVWSYFSSVLTSTSNTFTSNAGIFGKVYFPRLCIPLSVVISNFISFGIRFGLFLAMLVYFMLAGSSIHPNLWILLLPVMLLIMAGIALGAGIVISSLTTKYRDLQYLVSFGVQLLMYGTPVIYPISTVQGIWRWLILVNPITPVIETFRLAFLGTGTLSPIYLLYSIAFMLVILCIGVLVFNRVESNFMDTV
ncbi:MAG TPA: ABC transporter permease [Anaerolineales bacterium]|nr:ABC transporter permease [Anaerolineales bacterium]